LYPFIIYDNIIKKDSIFFEKTGYFSGCGVFYLIVVVFHVENQVISKMEITAADGENYNTAFSGI